LKYTVNEKLRLRSIVPLIPACKCLKTILLIADIVVGAPYETEDRGAIYIFKVAHEKKAAMKMSLVQKVSAQDVSWTIPLYGFGVSISHPVDIDGNGTPGMKNVF
jgi:hypothetical protein